MMQLYAHLLQLISYLQFSFSKRINFGEFLNVFWLQGLVFLAETSSSRSDNVFNEFQGSLKDVGLVMDRWVGGRLGLCLW